MRRYQIISTALFLLITGCSKQTVNQPIGTNRTAEENKIVQLAYNINYQYPNGFYKNDSGYYENTVSVTPLSDRKNIWIELSTNNRNQALAWSDSSDEYSSVHRVIISESETERYFEFKRQSTSNINDIIFSRIHKTSYFLPLLDRFKMLDTIGIYNGQLDTSKAKEFVEYLWSCGSLGIYSFKVIESQINEYNDYFQQYIKSFKVVYGDIGLRDSIFVYDSYFKLDKSSRILTIASKQVDAFEGNNSP
jgi:hypothetical protein